MQPGFQGGDDARNIAIVCEQKPRVYIFEIHPLVSDINPRHFSIREWEMDAPLQVKTSIAAMHQNNGPCR